MKILGFILLSAVTIAITSLIILLPIVVLSAEGEVIKEEVKERLQAAYGSAGIKVYEEMDGVKPSEEVMKGVGLNKAEREGLLKWFEKEALSLNKAGLELHNSGKVKEAIPYIEMALEITSKVLGKEHSATVRAVNFLAGLYTLAGSLSEAENLYKEALEINEKRYGKDHPAIAASLVNISLLYKSIGRSSEAEPLLLRALRICETSYGGEHPATTAVITNLALLYDEVGRYSEAETLYLKALSIDEKLYGAEDPQLTTTLNNLATLYYNVGRYSEAETLYLKALKIEEKLYGTEHPQISTALNNLGTLYYAVGRHLEAEALYVRALKIDEKSYGAEDPLVAADLNNLATLYKETGRYSEAEKFYERSLKISEMAGEVTPSLVISLNNLALLYESTGRSLQAEVLFKRALKMNERLYGTQHPQVSVTANNLATLYFREGRYEEAEPLYIRAIEIGERTLGRDHPDVAMWKFNLALLYASSNRHTQSHKLLKEAIEIESKKRDDIFTFLSEKQKLSYMERTQAGIYIFLSHLSQFNDKIDIDNALLVSETLNAWLLWKGAVLEAQVRYMEAVLRAESSEIKDKYERLIEVRRSLGKLGLFSSGNIALKEYKEKLNTLEKEKQELETELSRLSKDFSIEKLSGSTDIKRIVDILPQDAVYVDFANIYSYDFQKRKRDKQNYLVFVLSKEGTVRFIDLGESKEIDKHISSYLEEMKSPIIFGGLPDANILKKLGAELYNALIKPIELSLKGKIWLSPDGNLNLIPFEVLLNSEGRYLLEDYELSYITAGRDVIRFTDTTPPNKSVLIMADPDYDMKTGLKGAKAQLPPDVSGLRFNRLPDTKEEANEIEKILKETYKDISNYQDKKASEQALFSHKTPGILHLATHGYFLKDVNIVGQDEMGFLSGEVRELEMENPMLRSGVILAGANSSIEEGRDEGIVSAEKLGALRLKGTGLVTLSACDTGKGEVNRGEGVFGLKRTFILSGARTLLMSLWAIPSQETKELMIDFYSLMAEGKAYALRSAKLKMMKKNPNPFFWGAFILVGKP